MPTAAHRVAVATAPVREVPRARAVAAVRALIAIAVAGTAVRTALRGLIRIRGAVRIALVAARVGELAIASRVVFDRPRGADVILAHRLRTRALAMARIVARRFAGVAC